MRFCAEQGCSEKVERGRCASHAEAKRATERRFTSAQTSPAQESRYYPPVNYGRRWQRESKRFKADHPFCAECARSRRKTLATQTDHIVPHRGDPQLFWRESNWQPLCGECHSRKTAREVGLGSR
jgi:5-methylcytosine-specific restriction protein A